MLASWATAPALGVKRTKSAGARIRALEAETTPIGFQPEPRLNSHVPLPLRAVTAMPRLPWTVSMSVRLVPNSEATVAPVFGAPATSVEGSIGVPVVTSTGRSFTGSTVMLDVSGTEPKALLPVGSVQLPATPAEPSHTLKLMVAAPERFAFGTKRIFCVPLSSSTRVGLAPVSDCHTDPVVENCQLPKLSSTPVMAMPGMLLASLSTKLPRNNLEATTPAALTVSSLMAGMTKLVAR